VDLRIERYGDRRREPLRAADPDRLRRTSTCRRARSPKGASTPRPRSAEQERLFPPLVRVRYGESAPADAYVALRYRDRAFWIDDRDYASKTNLNILMMMFSLAETSAARGASPVATIPVR
jgi:hypothetical protein